MADIWTGIETRDEREAVATACAEAYPDGMTERDSVRFVAAWIASRDYHRQLAETEIAAAQSRLRARQAERGDH
jgi:hypothetical protein